MNLKTILWFSFLDTLASYADMNYVRQANNTDNCKTIRSLFIKFPLSQTFIYFCCFQVIVKQCSVNFNFVTDAETDKHILILFTGSSTILHKYLAMDLTK